MSLDVVDRQQRNIEHQRKRLRGGEADEQRTDQAGICRHRDGPDVGQGHTGVSQGFVDDGQDAFDVRARRDFGDNTPEPRVQFVLSRHDTGKDSPLAIDHRRRCLVARGLDGQ